MAKDKPPNGGGARGSAGVGLWQSDFQINVSGQKALSEIRQVDTALDKVQQRLERMEASLGKLGGTGRAGAPGAATYRTFDPLRGLTEPLASPGVQGPRTVNPMPLVFGSNVLSGGQGTKRRDPTPVIGDALAQDAEGNLRTVYRDAPRRQRNPTPYNPPERFESAFEQGASRQPVTAPYYTPQSPTANLTRRERVLLERSFARTDPYAGVTTQRGADRAYTVLRGQGVLGAIDGPVLDDVPKMRPVFDPGVRTNLYPTEQMTRRQRALLYSQQAGRTFNVQSAMDREYTESRGDGIRGALPLPGEGGSAFDGSVRNLYDGSSPFVPASSPWRASRAARVAYAVQGPLGGLRRGLRGAEALAGSVGQHVNTDRLLGLASGVYLGQEIGQAFGAVGRATVGQSVKIDEYQQLLANSLLGEDLGRPGAERLSERLIGAGYIPGMGLSTSELGMSRASLAEQYRGLAPIVRVGSKSTPDFVQRLQRGAVLSQLLLARDPSQGQAGVNVALSELLAGGGTRFLSLSRRFEMSNQQLRRIETAQGGEGVADPVQVAIRALEQMGLGPEYLRTRAERTVSGEMAQTAAIASNLRADLFQRSTGVLGRGLGTFNDALSTYQSTEAYGQRLDDLGGGFGGALGFVTRPMLQGIAGNMLRGGGRLDESYLTRSAAEMVQTRGGRYVDSQGEIVKAGEAFREAAEIIQDAHLEKLLQAPQYDPGQKELTELVVGAGLTLGGGMLLNRMFGGAGSLLLRGAMTPGIGLGSAARAAGIAAAPTAAVVGGSLAVGAGAAAYRRGAASADIYRQLSTETPELLDTLGYGGLERVSIDRFAGRDDPLGAAYNASMGIRDTTLNLLTWGRHGRNAYGESWGNFDQFLAQQGSRANIEGVLGDAISTSWRPGMSRQDLLAEARGHAFSLQRTARDNPGSPLAGYFAGPGAMDTALRAADKAAAGAPKASTRALLMSTLERAYQYSQPFGMVDPETGERVNLAQGFSMQQAQRFANRLTEDDPNTAGSVDYKKLYRAIERQAERAAQLAEGKPAQQKKRKTWEQQRLDNIMRLDLSKLPGVFSDYVRGEDVDPRELIPTNTPRNRQGRDRSKVQSLGDAFNSGSVERPITLEPLPLLSEDVSAGITPGMPLPYQVSSKAATEAFFGGQITANNAEHLARGTAGGGGLDVVSNTGQFYAPTGGKVKYLRNAEDYNKPLYQKMFPGGRDIYGVSAVVTDQFGKTFSVSHLADNPGFEHGGQLKKGDWLGAQSNTGLTKSGQYPGQLIRDGYLPDGSFAYGAGSHGHIQLGQKSGGKWQELDPQAGVSYWQASPEVQAATGASVNVVNNFTINKTADRAALMAQVEDATAKFRENLLQAVLDGDLEDMQEIRNETKRAQGHNGNPNKPQPRGNK